MRKMSSAFYSIVSSTSKITFFSFPMRPLRFEGRIEKEHQISLTIFVLQPLSLMHAGSLVVVVVIGVLGLDNMQRKNFPAFS